MNTRFFPQCGLLKQCCHIFAALVIFQLILFSASTNATAQYLYFDSPSTAHRQLIEDLQNRELDTTNLTPEAVDWLGTMEGFLMSLAHERTRVCQTLQMVYPNGSDFSLSTHHGDVRIDWVVKVVRSPELVIAVTGLPLPRRDQGAAPGSSVPNINGPNPSPNFDAPTILPFPGGDAPPRPTPPTTLGCSDRQVLASQDDRERACARWPLMCQRRR